MNYKKILLIVVPLIILTGIGIWFYLLSTTATLIVSAPQESEIYVKESGEEFRLLGKNEVEFKTRSSNEIIFEARKDSLRSQKTIKPEANKTIKVELEFEKQLTLKSVAKVAMSNFLIENGLVYGINTHTKSFISVPTNNSVQPSPVTPLLPNLKKIIYKNGKNFLYISLGKGTGIVENNKVQEDEIFKYSDASIIRDNKLALLGKDGLYIGDRDNLENAKKINGYYNDSSPSVFSNSENIYMVSRIYEESEEGILPKAKENKLQIFNPDGVKLKEITINTQEKINNVIQLSNESVAALTTDDIYFINTENSEISNLNFSFGQVKDSIIFKDELFLLGTDGLWRFRRDSNDFVKMAEYPKEQEYVPLSLTVLNGEMFFSTSITDNALKDSKSNETSNIFRVEY